MNYRKTNNVVGWVVFTIAALVYILTMERSGSLWDCGEFASSAYKLQIPHPPGAPLFVILGRLFMIPFGTHNAVVGVNLMSALASAFTILFLFWTITHYAAKLLVSKTEPLTKTNLIAIMGAGAVGALAYTFTDSFWFSAVEAEVYALSSFFTAIVFWAMTKWEQNVTHEEELGIKGHFTKADRWIILIFFLMGLSVGVHLLNLLTLPAIVVMYYYKRYKVTKWGVFWAFVIGCVITGFTQKAVIQWTISLAAGFDIWFKNSFGLPFFAGYIFYFVLLAFLAWVGLRYANRKNYNFLKLGIWSFVFMIIGISTYNTTMIRSNANPAIDMYNVEYPTTLKGYLSREQYGDWPILYGQDFTDEPEENKEKDYYIVDHNQYVKDGKQFTPVYKSSDKHLFPRMWDRSNDQHHADYYAAFTGIGKDAEGNWERKPTMGENISFMVSYQFNWMYWRYFMWNFAGKENDVQGMTNGNPRDGNWRSGVLDNIRLGDVSKLPKTIQENKANNKLYFLPLILGILGLIFLIKNNKRDAFVTFLLFFFTGAAIVIYLNQPGMQPRERDYAYVGSFYAFALWIGLGVLWVRKELIKPLKSINTATIAAIVITLLTVPTLMAAEEWDDHDRSKKTLAKDLATNYLMSCPQNAILFCFGDNDTYPLWYAQEVEGIRKDVRVVNTSLLGADWYVNQLRYKINESDLFDVMWTADQIIGTKRQVVYNAPVDGIDPNSSMDLYTMMKDYVGSDAPDKTVLHQGERLNVFPTQNVTVPVDVNYVRSSGMATAADSVAPLMSFKIPGSYLTLDQSTILNILATSKWKRPICFTNYYTEIGFGDYLRQEGMVFRLVPFKSKTANNEWSYDKLMNFKTGNCQTPGVYFDEENRRHLLGIRGTFFQIAYSLVNSNEKEKANNLLMYCDKMMNEQNMPYALVSRNQDHNEISMKLAYVSYLAGNNKLGDKICNELITDMQQQQTYYESFGGNKRELLANEENENSELLANVQSLYKYKGLPPNVPQPKTPEQKREAAIDTAKP